MINCFLYALLIVMPSNVMGSNIRRFEPDLHRAIKLDYNGHYFHALSDDQWEMYRPQMSVRNSEGLLPIEAAAYYVKPAVLNILVLNGAEVKSSKVLALALKTRYGFSLRPETISFLLARGATTDFLIESKKPIHYLEGRRPLLASQYLADELRIVSNIITILEEHESQKRWSPLRAAWSSAVVRARSMKVTQVQGSLCYSVALGRFVDVAPSASVAELK